MNFSNIEVRTVQLYNRKEREEVEGFLAKHSLRLENDVEYSLAMYDRNRMIATGSFTGNVLKCIAVDADYEGRGVAVEVVSRLISEEYNRGKKHLFIYTKPENANKFEGLGFYTIEQVESKVVLMENRQDGIESYTKQLEKHKTSGNTTGSIVVNCNPFTKGHLYLIEKAASECEKLHIFVVWEDRSVFPTSVRYRLVKEGVKHLDNVMVHSGGNYIISNATFPKYFLKCPDEAVELQCLLDVKIFARYIAPALGIRKRYIGEEPYCQVTQAYNRTMKEILPSYGIDVIEAPRKSISSAPISASLVRKHLREGNMSIVRTLVPDTTYNFLVSEDAVSILDNIKE